MGLLSTLLHEAAHGVADTRGVQDVSRGGRYHNGRFAAIAREPGLDVERSETLGWSASSVPDVTAAAYADELAVLGGALTAWRRSEHAVTTGSGNDGEGQDDGGAAGLTFGPWPGPHL
jgi:hypothetical protein